MAQHPRVPITIRTDHFEGPLDLLLYLISTHELDISRIAISKITDQYLNYIRMMRDLNFDVASDFLVLAATLILWKSRTVLPKDEEETNELMAEEDELTPEKLIQQLLEHKRFLAMGEELATRPLLNEDVFARSNKKPPVERVWREMNVTDLSLSFQDIVTRSRKRKRVLRKETVSLSEKIAEFADHLEVGVPIEIRKLISLAPEKGEIVVAFLACLELSRLRKLKSYQEGTYQEIFLELLETLQNFDLDMAKGFDMPVMETGLGTEPTQAGV